MPNALLSVSDKTGIVDFAHPLHEEFGWNLYASGGTAEAIQRGEVPVIDTATIAGGGSTFKHAVVTLSRQVHMGLMAEDTPEDRAILESEGIPPFDLLVDDPYPLHRAIVEGRPYPEVQEQYDIGGPTMIRSALKRGRFVVCDPGDYREVLAAMRSGVLDQLRPSYRMKARRLLAGYEAVMAWYEEFWENPEEGRKALVGSYVASFSTHPQSYPSTASFFVLIGGFLTGGALHPDRDRLVDAIVADFIQSGGLEGQDPRELRECLIHEIVNDDEGLRSLLRWAYRPRR